STRSGSGMTTSLRSPTSGSWSSWPSREALRIDADAIRAVRHLYSAAPRTAGGPRGGPRAGGWVRPGAPGAPVAAEMAEGRVRRGVLARAGAVLTARRRPRGVVVRLRRLLLRPGPGRSAQGVHVVSARPAGRGRPSARDGGGPGRWFGGPSDGRI